MQRTTQLVLPMTTSCDKGWKIKEHHPVDNRLSQLERAFELASSGRCTTVADIKRKLREEGYLDDQVEGRLLFNQLNALMKKSTREPQSRSA